MKKLPYKKYLAGSAKVLQKSKSEKKKYAVEILGRKFVVYPNVFSPKYYLDTEFFARELPINKGEEFLEIGPGIGATVVFAVLRGAKNVTAIDINPDAAANTKENVQINGVEDKVTVLQGDIYEPLTPNSKFDTIYWNTPFGYIDKNQEISDLEKAVFDPGYKATHRFVSQARKHLKKDGRLLIGFSTTLGKFDILQTFLEEAGFTVRLVTKEESREIYPVYFEIFEAVVSN
ncbi:MAG: class I SAM-dependent methyltransferase [Parcubacteria group bacterium]|nr:class I SAM-dependent methyltransferase [Parcubacteria group bacterium]